MTSQLTNQDTPLMLGFIKVNILCSGVSKNISGRAACERESTDKDLGAHFNFPEFLKSFRFCVWKKTHDAFCVWLTEFNTMGFLVLSLLPIFLSAWREFILLWQNSTSLCAYHKFCIHSSVGGPKPLWKVLPKTNESESVSYMLTSSSSSHIPRREMSCITS